MKIERKKLIALIAGATAGVAIIAGAVAWSYAGATYSGAESVRVCIPKNIDADSVSAILSRDLGRAGARAASLWRFTGGSPAVAHGSYVIEPGTSAFRIYRRVAGGAQSPVKFTFNNIRLLPQLVGRMSRLFEADSTAITHAVDSVLSAHGCTPEEYVGAFFPDTYEYYWTATPGDIVTSLLNVHERFWTGERCAKAKALGLTPRQAEVIASIAEEETNSASERGTVARLYLNRFQRGMALQADPTVKFAVGDFSLKRITGAHLAVESPYNTYRHPGLPPGPIRMPERATIDALLNSEPHNYIYMCASPDFSGRHNFAADFATHSRNAAAYHRALNQRNIK
jgi:UPF0755 protein